MRLYCPQCHKKFDAVEFDTCPDDGARLFSLSEKREDPLLGTVLDDRFRIEALLSEGGMGAVYRATQLSVNREVALKVVRPDLEGQELFMERFFREARVIAELSHPNIVRLIDFGQDRSNELLYLVMELVRGTDMGALLERGRLDVALALDVVYQVCAGLTEPHSRGIVHRDLKPDNIILLPISDGTFQVKVLDFGIARTEEIGTQLTQTGMICGTPSYMSPEQAQNQSVDERTDLYSLGVLLFEMLTGHLPFRADSGLQVLMNHIQRPAPRLSEAYPKLIPETVSTLVADLMEKHPDDRPRSAMVVRRRVQEIREELKLPPVFLREGTLELEPGERGGESLFGSWIFPGIDPDEVYVPDPEGFSETLEFAGTLPAKAVDEVSLQTLEFSGTTRAEGFSEAESGVVSDEVEPEGFEETTPSSDSPTEESDKRRLLLAVLVAAGVLVVGGLGYLLAGIGTTELTEEVSEAEYSAVADEPDEPDELEEVSQEAALAAAEERVVEAIRLASGEEESVEEESVEEVAEPVVEEDPVVEAVREEVAELVVSEPPVTEAPSVEPSPAAVQIPIPGQPSSSRIYEGSIVLESPSHVPAASNYEEITGDLVIRINVDNYTHLELPDLKKLGGSLILDPLSKVVNISLPSLEVVGAALMSVEGPRLGNLNAPNLRSIGNNLILTSTQVRSFHLPRLARVDGMVMISQNAELTSVSFSALERIGGGLSLMENTQIQSLTTTDLQEVGGDLLILSGEIKTVIMDKLHTIGGGVTLNDNQALEVLRMSSLTSVGKSSRRPATFNLHGSPRLDELRMGNLEEVSGGVSLSGMGRLSRINLSSLEKVGTNISLNENDAVEVIELDSLARVGERVFIGNHPQLHRLTMSGIEEVEEISIVNSPRLSVCEQRSMAAKLESRGWEGRAQFNLVLEQECD